MIPLGCRLAFVAQNEAQETFEKSASSVDEKDNAISLDLTPAMLLL